MGTLLKQFDLPLRENASQLNRNFAMHKRKAVLGHFCKNKEKRTHFGEDTGKKKFQTSENNKLVESVQYIE